MFGIPGAHTYDFYDALFDATSDGRIKLVTTRHEQGAGYMAYGYARSSGRVGVYSVVPGPGVLNSGAALCTALSACTPTLCVTAEIPAEFIGKGRGILHELPDQLATLRSITKWSQRIDRPADASPVVAEAFLQMRNGRPGPVAIETPWDVFGQRAEVEIISERALLSPPAPDEDSLARAVELIRAAESPMITVGAGAIDAGAEVLELAQLLQAPVTAHRSGRGIVSEELPYGFSCGEGIDLWMGTDLLIGIGSRLELEFLRWRRIPEGLRVIRIDIDAEEFERLPPDVGIEADAAAATGALVELLRDDLESRPSREQEFSQVKAAAREKFRRVRPQIDYLDVIRNVLPRDGFFVEEITQVGFTARFGFPVYEPRTYVTSGYQDNLGFGFNTALGVKVANPDTPVVSISGDGGFLYGVQELATAVQHEINLVSIVFNNQSFGNVLRDQQTEYGGRTIGSELIGLDFVSMAESFGAVAFAVKTPAELQPALERALGLDRPVVIEVQLKRGSEASPWEFIRPSFD